MFWAFYLLVEQIISVFTKVIDKDRSHSSPPLLKPMNTHMHPCTQTTKRMEGCIQSNFTLLFSVSFFLFSVDYFTPDNLLACGERSHVEKRRSTCNMISKWLAPQQAPSRPVYLDEVVHCTLSAYSFKPDTVCTINNSFCLHMWLTAGVCMCMCVCF